MQLFKQFSIMIQNIQNFYWYHRLLTTDIEPDLALLLCIFLGRGNFSQISFRSVANLEFIQGRVWFWLSPTPNDKDFLRTGPRPRRWLALPCLVLQYDPGSSSWDWEICPNRVRLVIVFASEFWFFLRQIRDSELYFKTSFVNYTLHM